MGSVKVAKHMARNKLVRDLEGNIIDWLDDSLGGWIVRKGEVVNQKVWDDLLKKEADKREAAQAINKQITAPPEVVEARNNKPEASQIDGIKKELDDFKKDVDNKFNQILEALKK